MRGLPRSARDCRSRSTSAPTAITDVKTVDDLKNNRENGLAGGLQRQWRYQRRHLLRAEGPAGYPVTARSRCMPRKSAGTRIVYDPATLSLLVRGCRWRRQGRSEGRQARGYTTWTARLLKAAYNYQVSVKDPGRVRAQCEVHHRAAVRLDRGPERQDLKPGRHEPAGPR